MHFEKTTTHDCVEISAGRKCFTVDEANRALCYIQPIIRDLTDCYRRLVEYRRELDDAQTPAETEQSEQRYEQAMDRLSGYVDELQHAGVELKDFEKGSVDFPTLHEGREVYLCWQLGEDKIIAWHESQDGYADRQPVHKLSA